MGNLWVFTFSPFSLKLLPNQAEILHLFILKGVDLLHHTGVFLLRTINHRVFLYCVYLSKYLYIEYTQYKNFAVIDGA